MSRLKPYVWGEESEGDIRPSSPVSGVSHWEGSHPPALPTPLGLALSLNTFCNLDSHSLVGPRAPRPTSQVRGLRLAGTPMAHTLKRWKPGLSRKALEKAPLTSWARLNGC